MNEPKRNVVPALLTCYQPWTRRSAVSDAVEAVRMPMASRSYSQIRRPLWMQRRFR